MSLPQKRPPSPLPRQFDEIVRIRLEDAKYKDKRRLTSPVDSALLLPARHGQEVLSLSSSLQHDPRHENINDLILQTTSQLAREGKRLVCAPRLLPDGIAFDWVSDATARNEGLRSSLSVAGIRSGDLEKVLLRATPAPGGSSRLASANPRSLSRSSTHSSPIPKGWIHGGPLAKSSNQGDASNPIVIDDDGDAAAAVEDTITAVVSAHVQEDIASSTSPETQHTEVLKIQIPSDDRSSVLSYASRRSTSPTSLAAMADATYGGPATTDRMPCSPNDATSLPHSPSDDPKPDVQSVAGNRRAEYGEWKVLGEDSSDGEMEGGHGSSRESSVARSFPPQPPLHRLPAGLHFLPHSYDTSGLFSQQSSFTSTSSRPGFHSTLSERHHPTPRPVSPLPRTKPYQLPNQALETPSRRITPDSSPHPRRLGRRKSLPNVQSSDHPEDDSDADSRYKACKSRVSLPRSGVGSRNLRMDQLSGSRDPRVSRVSASPSPSRLRPWFAARSASESSRSTDSSSEEEDHAPPSVIPSGHTVVIPKAEYARGRRLLAPVNPDSPLTTILMRGDAHFVDQRRKTRISSYSLPVEDDTRHVEDACLIGDETVIVGYNKGPCQVSLIPVGDDQPCRFDLNHKAHSTVNENRTAGKSYPNRGIASLAPVALNSFLSGGHDKTVHHWKLARSSARSKDRDGFSATSMRIPTDHTQAVQALAYCAWNDTVYSAAGDRIAATKLTALVHTDPGRVSGKITQVHVHPQDPRLIALEIDHMDYQVHLYDMRERGFACRPWLEFGYRAAAPKASRVSANASATTSRSTSSASIPKSGSRYTRGSTTHSLFARGYGDGVVLVWDFRNGAQKKVLERFQFERPAEVAHTVLAGSDVIAYGAYSVTFWSTLAAKA